MYKLAKGNNQILNSAQFWTEKPSNILSKASFLIASLFLSHTHTHIDTVLPEACFKHNPKRWQEVVIGGLCADIHPLCHCLPKAQCKCQRSIVIHGDSADHTPHFHALFTSSLARPLLHSRARVTNKRGSMNDGNQIFMPEPVHLGRGTWPPGRRGWSKKSSASGRREGAGTVFVVAIYTSKEECCREVFFFFFCCTVCLPCWFSVCRFVCVQTYPGIFVILLNIELVMHSLNYGQ